MSTENNISPKFIPDLSGKFLFMRHSESIFNKKREDPTRVYNPDLCDAHLSEEGIAQSKSRQEDLNKLKIKKVFVSPYYRALETMTYAFESYPGNIIAIVHPKISEVVCCGNDFIIDIKKTKEKFNMNSKIKVDWSLFDEFIKKSKYDENFFYFENINLLDEKIKEEEYLKLKSLFDNGYMEEYKKEIGKFLKENYEHYKKYESFKHSNERFEQFKNFLKNEFKDSFNDKDKKILCVSHSALINAAISSVPFLKDEIEENAENLYQIKNAEIISIII